MIDLPMFKSLATDPLPLLEPARRFYPLGEEQVVALKERLDTMHSEKVSET